VLALIPENISTIFSDYPWLSGVVNPSTCEGTTIQVYRSVGFVYLYVQIANSSILYNAQGQLYCTSAPNFNCLDFYSVDEVIENYACGSEDGQRSFPIQTPVTTTINTTTDFMLYPNPSSGRFFIKLGANSNTDRTLIILNTQGQIIQERKLISGKEQRIQIDMERQASGMYYIQLRSDEAITVKRMVIR